MNSLLKTRFIYFLLCAALLWSMTACTARNGSSEYTSSASSAVEEAKSEKVVIPDFEAVTAGIDLAVPQKLAVLRPPQDVEIHAENYYITGSSDPALPLLLDGEKVEGRGELGSFGVFVELNQGKNTFVFTQGEASKTVTITRQADGEMYTTDKITRPSPEADDVIRTGEPYTLRCIAPSGAAVTAQVQGETVSLKQKAATDVEGVPATFTAEFIPHEITGTENIGPVTYTLNWKGKESEYTSKGSLFAVGSASPLLVRAKDVSATVFVEESTESDYFSTLKRGAVDIVTEIGVDMYKLAMGGWVVKASLEPLTTAVETENKVSEADYTAGIKTETLLLTGTAAVPYRAEQKDGQLVFTFYRTSGVGEIALKDSKLFKAVQASLDGENTTLVFQLDAANPLWGYLVEYKEDGILLTFKAAPKLAAGSKPLQGITVMLDPGHGGTDIGTPGIVGESTGVETDAAIPGQDGNGAGVVRSVVEKDINLATAGAARNYLEALGAVVLMAREGDETVSMNDRLEKIQQPEVDFMISLHCNSIPDDRDGTGPSGTEVYYYEDAAAPLAEAVLQGICERTGRDIRSTQQGNYKITLNSNAPSIMVELGFITNPWEYDNLCEKQAIYDTAAAIADGIMTMLS